RSLTERDPVSRRIGFYAAGPSQPLGCNLSFDFAVDEDNGNGLVAALPEVGFGAGVDGRDVDAELSGDTGTVALFGALTQNRFHFLERHALFYLVDVCPGELAFAGGQEAANEEDEKNTAPLDCEPRHRAPPWDRSDFRGYTAGWSGLHATFRAEAAA